MRVSGFTIARNVVLHDYPIVESMTSILPIVDEYIVNVGDSDDGTLDLVRSIRSPKIKMIETTWDQRLNTDGRIFAEQTNVALSHCTGDWAFYLQADEVVPEDALPRIRNAMETYLTDPRVMGLMFRYVHFFGDYYSVNPWGGGKEIRIVRNHAGVESSGDASGFRCTTDGRDLKSTPDRWRWAGAQKTPMIYHYGYVKSPDAMVRKLQYQARQHYGAHAPETPEALDSFTVQGLSADRQAQLFQIAEFPFEPHYGIMKEFRGRHPAVMADRIRRSSRLRGRRSRWLTWRFYREVLCHGFKG